jgi:hypothetical protein
VSLHRAQAPAQEQPEALVSFTARRVRALAGSTVVDDIPEVVAPMFKLMGAPPDEAPQTKALTAECVLRFGTRTSFFGSFLRTIGLQPACRDPLRG